MKNYIVYNSSGDILRSGFCQDDTFDSQAEENEFVLEGIANDSIHKIVDGEVVEKG